MEGLDPTSLGTVGAAIFVNSGAAVLHAKPSEVIVRVEGSVAWDARADHKEPGWS